MENSDPTADLNNANWHPPIAEAHIPTQAEQLGLPNDFVVRRGNEGPETAESGWKIADYKNVLDPEGNTVTAVKVEKQVTNPDGTESVATKVRSLNQLLNWNEPIQTESEPSVIEPPLQSEVLKPTEANEAFADRDQRLRAVGRFILGSTEAQIKPVIDEPEDPIKNNEQAQKTPETNTDNEAYNQKVASEIDLLLPALNNLQTMPGHLADELVQNIAKHAESLPADIQAVVHGALLGATSNPELLDHLYTSKIRPVLTKLLGDKMSMLGPDNYLSMHTKDLRSLKRSNQLEQNSDKLKINLGDAVAQRLIVLEQDSLGIDDSTKHQVKVLYMGIMAGLGRSKGERYNALGEARDLLIRR